MASVPGTWQQAVAWLEHESKRPSEDYTNLCAHLAASAFGYSGSGADASPWGRTVPEKYRVYGSHPPKGALVFWITGGYGHVAVSYGNGRVICNNAQGKVSVQNISYYSGLGQPFWVRRENLKRGIAFKLAWGRNPHGWPARASKPKPAPKPAPKVDANPIVARPGVHAAGVPALRAALGGTYFDRVLKRKVIDYKKKHGIKPANAIVRKHLLDQIVKGK